MTDQPGKDVGLPPLPEAHEDHTTLRSFYSQSDLALGVRIILSVAKGGIYKSELRIVIPKPASYETALLIAFYQFGGFLPKMHAVDITTEDLFFAHRFASSDAWATLPSEFWSEVVQNGDQLVVSLKGAEVQPLRSGPLSGSASAKYIKLLDKSPSASIAQGHHGRVVLFPRPHTYQEAKLVATLLFYKKQPTSPIQIFVRVKQGGSEGWQLADSKISDVEWKKLMEGYEDEVGIAVHCV